MEGAKVKEAREMAFSVAANLPNYVEIKKLGYHHTWNHHALV